MNIEHIRSSLLAPLLALFLAQAFSLTSLAAGVWLQGKSQRDPILGAKVNFVMMYWGEDNGKDCIIGQLASEDFHEVEVVLESPTENGQFRRLTFAPAIQLCDRGNHPCCWLCDYYSDGDRRHSYYYYDDDPSDLECYESGMIYSTKERAVYRRDVSGKRSGHAFRIYFDGAPTFRTLWIADVRADGRSVKYTVGSLTDRKILKDTSTFRSKVRSNHYERYHDFDCIQQVVSEKTGQEVSQAKKPRMMENRFATKTREKKTPEPKTSDRTSFQNAENPFADEKDDRLATSHTPDITIKTYIDHGVTFSIRDGLIRWFKHPSQNSETPLNKRIVQLNHEQWLPLWRDGNCQFKRIPFCRSLQDLSSSGKIKVKVLDTYSFRVKTIQPSKENDYTLSAQIEKSYSSRYDDGPKGPYEIAIEWE